MDAFPILFVLGLLLTLSILFLALYLTLTLLWNGGRYAYRLFQPAPEKQPCFVWLRPHYVLVGMVTGLVLLAVFVPGSVERASERFGGMARSRR